MERKRDITKRNIHQREERPSSLLYHQFRKFRISGAGILVCKLAASTAASEGIKRASKTEVNDIECGHDKVSERSLAVDSAE